MEQKWYQAASLTVSPVSFMSLGDLVPSGRQNGTVKVRLTGNQC